VEAARCFADWLAEAEAVGRSTRSAPVAARCSDAEAGLDCRAETAPRFAAGVKAGRSVKAAVAGRSVKAVVAARSAKAAVAARRAA